MRRLFLVAVLMLGWSASSTVPAFAIAEFKDAFEAKYVTGGNPALAPTFKAAGCTTCHVKGKSKKERNEYGQALSKLLGGNVQSQLKQAGPGKQALLNKFLKKLYGDFTTVENEKASTGETFGNRINAGKLPSP